MLFFAKKLDDEEVFINYQKPGRIGHSDCYGSLRLAR